MKLSKGGLKGKEVKLPPTNYELTIKCYIDKDEHCSNVIIDSKDTGYELPESEPEAMHQALSIQRTITTLNHGLALMYASMPKNDADNLKKFQEEHMKELSKTEPEWRKKMMQQKIDIEKGGKS